MNQPIGTDETRAAWNTHERKRLGGSIRGKSGIHIFNSSKPVKIQFHIRGLNVHASSRRWLEQSLGRLQSLVSITAAAVVLEHRQDDGPAFRAYVWLAVCGPDIHAEARDHTLEAAWLKVITALRNQIEQPKAKQLMRLKPARERPIFIAPWSRGGAPR